MPARILTIADQGPWNRFAPWPAIVAEIDFGELAHRTSGDIPGRRLAALEGEMPTLRTEPFVEGARSWLLRDRAAEGTLGPAALVALLGLAVQRMLGYGLGGFGTVRQPAPGRAIAVFETRDAPTGLLSARCAVALLDLLLAPPSGDVGDTPAIHALLDRYREQALATGLDQTTIAILRAADRRGIPWARLREGSSEVRLGQGARQRRLRETLADPQPALAVLAARNKAETLRLLRQQALPVPESIPVLDPDAAVAAAQKIGFPVVVKPNDLHKGTGISIGVRSEAGVRAAFAHARGRQGSLVLVEQLIEGRDHRLLVVGDRLVAAAERLPASVTGDGRRSVSALVAEVNRDPRRARGFTSLMNLIEIDREALDLLAEAGLTPEAVPDAGRVVPLRRVANVSSGGTAIDVTDRVHPDNALMAVRAAKAVGLAIAGIDFLTPDIGRSWLTGVGRICEVNASLGLRPHWLSNPSRDVVGPILEAVVPAGQDGRIPTVAVTGTNGKTTTCRMIASILARSGRRVGLATTDGVTIGGRWVALGDLAGAPGARLVFGDGLVDAAVLETARGGLQRRGTGFDRCDVAAVLNIAADHVGQDGIPDLDALAALKGRVALSARRAVVLNADDDLTRRMADSAGSRRVILFTLAPELEGPRPARCDDLLTLEAGEIVWTGAEGRVPILAAGAIPATHGGRAVHNTANALAAIGLALGLGLPVETIREALAGFDSGGAHSPGRLNHIEGLPFGLLLDFANNPPALRAVVAYVDGLACAGRRIAAFTAPGNRPDDHLRDMGRVVAGHFDHYLCYEREDWYRGRAPGAVSQLLADGLAAAGVEAAQIRHAATLDAMLEQLFDLAGPGDLVALFGSDFRATLPALQKLAAARGIRPAAGPR